MDDFAAIKIASAGMTAQRTRLRVIAENLANIHTTGTDGPYNRKETILQSKPLDAATFESQLDLAVREVLSAEEIAAIKSVTVSEVREDGAEPILRFDPTHPHAIQTGENKGYVELPNISVMREMADMLEATRSYQANMAVARTSKEMIQGAMELLG